jgi:hypothetical protein
MTAEMTGETAAIMTVEMIDETAAIMTVEMIDTAAKIGMKTGKIGAKMTEMTGMTEMAGMTGEGAGTAAQIAPKKAEKQIGTAPPGTIHRPTAARALVVGAATATRTSTTRRALQGAVLGILPRANCELPTTCMCRITSRLSQVVFHMKASRSTLPQPLPLVPPLLPLGAPRTTMPKCVTWIAVTCARS